MLDINNVIINPRRFENDPEGNLADLASWSPNYANRLAEEDGFVLTDVHWEIIYYLRERYREHGNIDNARKVLHDLEEQFCEGLGRAYLYKLFPQGPVTQASRLAGLPLPPHTHDLSFGTVM